MASMDLMALLSTIVLVATISTTIFAVAAYVVSRGYLRRRKADAPAAGTTPGAPPVPPAPRKITSRQTAILKRYDPYGAGAKDAGAA